MPSACHCDCSSAGSCIGRGKLAQATVLHSKASAPALFQPGGVQAGSSACRKGCAWFREISTLPVSLIKVKTGLIWRKRNLAFRSRAATFQDDGAPLRRSGPGHSRADQHGENLPRDRADVRPQLGRHRLSAPPAGPRSL